jgi:acyl carrier protein
VVREDKPGEKRLVVYAGVGKEATTEVELRRYLKERLPEYMVPQSYVIMEELPVGPSGKIDPKTLPEPKWSLAESEEGYVAPRTPVEEIMVEIWSDVLGVEQIGVHDNFFELGGHSLLVTQVFVRLRAAFQVELPLRRLFEAPTVAALAALVECELGAETKISSLPLQAVPREGDLPLSFAQQRLWFLDQLEPGSSAYNIPMAVRLCGELDLSALERSLNEVVRRHEVLRTTFSQVAGQGVQVIREPEAMTLPVVDLLWEPEAERETAAQQMMLSEAQFSFDLEKGPLLRAKLFRLRMDEHVIMVTMHHIITDGWSMGVLIREVGALYQAFALGQSSPLPELPIQYADYAAWQRQWMNGEALESHLSYWKQQLAGELPSLELPTDRPRPSVQSFNGARESMALGPELSRNMEVMSREQGATLFMTLLTAFQALLYRYTWKEDVLVGTSVANRNHIETERLIGFFINMLVLRTDCSGNPTFDELLARVRQVTLGAYAHQEMPFELLVNMLQLKRDLSRTPLLQVCFVLDMLPMPVLELPGIRLIPLIVEGGTARLDLTMSIGKTSQELMGSLQYNTDLFEPQTIRNMLKNYLALLEAMVADPKQRVLDIQLHIRGEQRFSPDQISENKTIENPLDTQNFLF